MDFDVLGFQFAKELTTQLITLSTGLLALSATFAKEIAKAVPAARVRRLKIGWGILIFSIVFGIWHLMALTGILMPADGLRANPVRIGFSARLPGFLQIVSFLAGVVTLLTVWTGNIDAPAPAPRAEFQIVTGTSEQVVLALGELKRDRWEVVGFTAREGDKTVALIKRDPTAS